MFLLLGLQETLILRVKGKVSPIIIRTPRRNEPYPT